MDHVSSLASFIYAAVVIVVIITLVSTNMNLRNYLMIRNRDYHFLAILGIRPQMLYLLLCVEFAMGSLLAILVTHDPYIASFADEAIILKDGLIERRLVNHMEKDQFFKMLIEHLNAF